MKGKNKTLLFKKTLNILPVLFTVVAVVYLGLFIKDIEFPAVLPVTDIVVKGKLDFVNKEEVKALVKRNMSGGYFTVDLRSIRDLLQHKPWVKNAAIRRQWPAGLTVYIEEQVAVAYWNKDAYLSEDGSVFQPEIIDVTLNLPKLNGPVGQHDKVWKFMNVLYKETAMLDYEVVQLTLDDRRAWQLLLAKNVPLARESAANDSAEVNLVEVKLGRFDTAKRLQRFVDILPILIAEPSINISGFKEKKIKVIDMRYPNGFAVQFAENCSLHFLNFSHSCEPSEA